MSSFFSVLLAVAVLVVPFAACRADAPREMKSFPFAEGKKLEWVTNDGVTSIKQVGSQLHLSTTASDPLLIGPEFSIPADSRQYVEITMQSSADGTPQLYYTNTKDEPYGGIRGEWSKSFNVKKGVMRVYRVFPFWGSLGKIIRLRLDPPDSSQIIIKSIRIMQLPDGDVGSLVWKQKQAPTWSLLGDTKAKADAVSTTGELLMISPKLSKPTAKVPWISLMAKSTGASQAIVQWTTDDWKEPRSQVIALKPDGAWHSYNISTEPLADWTGTLQMMTLAVTSPAGKPTEIKLFGASEKPLGLAELSAPQFMLEQNFVRVGQPASLMANIMNSGGTSTKPLKLSIRWSTKLPPQLEPGQAKVSDRTVKTVPAIVPGDGVVLNWNLDTQRAGWVKAELMAEGMAEPIATSVMQIHPVKPDLPQGQIPPVMAPKSDYDVGVYYFPGWWNYSRWTVLDAYPERTPLLGYYREGEPAVADWHIKWMAEHGINFMIYDWYWSEGGRSLEHALHNGFFNADLRNQMKFCLLWANHNAPGTSSEEDMKNVTQYWLDNCFLRPEYYKIDGKPVVVIFAPSRIWDDIGVAAAKRAFDNARQMAKDRGLPGIYFVACSGPDGGALRLIEQQGYDAISGYNYPGAGTDGQTVAPYDLNIKGYEDIWKSIAKNSPLRYIPVTDPGWDSRPWAGPNAMRRTEKAPWKFEQMLELSKKFVDTEHAKNQRKIVFVEAWNELGEGAFIEPHREWGFGYLDAVRRVFTPNAGPHTDIVPEDVGMGPYSLPRPVPATSWDFSDPAHAGWDTLYNVADFKVADGKLSGRAENYDPSLTSQTLDVKASKVKAIVITMRVSAGKGAQLFWSAPGAGTSEAASMSFELIPGDKVQTYRLELSQNPRWKGSIAGLRFDPTDEPKASFEIESIKLEMK